MSWWLLCAGAAVFVWAVVWLARWVRRRRWVARWFAAGARELAAGEVWWPRSTGEVVAAANCRWTVEGAVENLYRNRPEVLAGMGPELFARRLLAERDVLVTRQRLAESSARLAGEMVRVGLDVRRELEDQ